MIIELRNVESSKGGQWVFQDLCNVGVDVYQGDQTDVTLHPEQQEHLDYETKFRVEVTSLDHGLLREIAAKAEAAGIAVDVTE